MFDENGRLELGWDDVIFYPWSAVGADLSAEINSIRYINEGFDSISLKDKKAKNLGNLRGNLILMGHGNATAKVIAGGGEEGNRSRPVGDLARVLQKWGLSTDYSGNVIVWTCYGGVPGGLAQHLSRELKARDYHSLKVWGFLHLTGTFQYRLALVRRDKPGVLRRMFSFQCLKAQEEANGYAMKEDLRCYA